ncbi:hypothetical protein ACW0JT_16215 [Arthrobacter sp. SA17]
MLAELAPEEAAVVATGLGMAPGTVAVPAVLRAAVRLLDALSLGQPLVLVLDDLHWAEPTLLDLVDLLVGSGKGKLLVLCLGRPELLEQRHGWSDTLFLEPLPTEDVATLLRARAPGIDDGAVTTIVDRARGTRCSLNSSWRRGRRRTLNRFRHPSGPFSRRDWTGSDQGSGTS